MTPDKTAELRRLYDEYQRTRALMVESVPVPGGPETGWSAACEANAAARSAWVELLHKHEADLLATAEREAVQAAEIAELRKAIERLINAVSNTVQAFHDEGMGCIANTIHKCLDAELNGAALEKGGE